MKYTLDAQGKKIGRVASEAAKILMGKNSPDYAPNKEPEALVEIINASKADVSQSKLKENLQSRFSGYPGGITTETIGQVLASKGHTELFKRAVYGMLPSNKLRSKMMQNLTISK